MQEEKLALIMVGLPARGKSFTARKIDNYLTWLGYRTQIFNVGEYRREQLPGPQSHHFFDPGNKKAAATRHELARAVLERMLGWLAGEGEVAIYDATNTTRDRRRFVAERLEAAGVRYLFVENVCNDEALIENNIRATKLGSPDYAGSDPNEAAEDFRARIAHYEKGYEEVGADEGPYVRLIDAGRLVVVNSVDGFLEGRVVSFLMNLHYDTPPVWLTRHGESISNLQERIGGDSSLSPRGHRYARALAAYMRREVADPDGLMVWTSSLERTAQTGSYVHGKKVSWRALDEIDAGLCDGMTYDEIQAGMPDEFEARRANKLLYRYPRGESYQDVIQRLDPMVVELERRREPLLVIAHQAVVRLLYAYLMGIQPRDATRLDMPLHCVIQLTPHAYGCSEERTRLAERVVSASSS